jgi:hypothetical protein
MQMWRKAVQVPSGTGQLLKNLYVLSRERAYNQRWLLLSHIRNRLSAQSTCALLCLGAWSKIGYVDLDDLNVAASLPDVTAEETWTNDEWDVVG